MELPSQSMSIVSINLADMFENQYVPAYYVFDREGKLRHFQAGGSGMKMLEKRVNEYLDEMEKPE